MLLNGSESCRSIWHVPLTVKRQQACYVFVANSTCVIDCTAVFSVEPLSKQNIPGTNWFLHRNFFIYFLTESIQFVLFLFCVNRVAFHSIFSRVRSEACFWQSTGLCTCAKFFDPEGRGSNNAQFQNRIDHKKKKSVLKTATEKLADVFFTILWFYETDSFRLGYVFCSYTALIFVFQICSLSISVQFLACFPIPEDGICKIFRNVVEVRHAHAPL